jgi:hypothetical protein
MLAAKLVSSHTGALLKMDNPHMAAVVRLVGRQTHFRCLIQSFRDAGM